ncbi:MAG TPA: hypothetical protein VK668_22745 [Mucilaginibacter sp.]|nr:hypothetical protein [Mucilaginibacter sp.]
MRDNTQYFHVNWIDGMKINKNLFIAQDDAVRNDLHDIASFSLSPIKYGVLPPLAAGQNTFNVNISLDNQNTLRVAILNCQAVTLGGVPINISAALKIGQNDADAIPGISYPMPQPAGESAFWVVLTINPFEKQPAGNLIIDETPPRFPFVLPVFKLFVISDTQYAQYASHPYGLMIGKVLVKGASYVIDEHYVPPCTSISAHPALIHLYSDLESFLNKFELHCSKIVQKIYSRKQKNDLSEMVLSLCERTLIQLTHVITKFRWTLIHESPAYMFEALSGLARLMKNTIDLHIDSGKDILINYFTEWCDPKQGEIEKILVNMANQRYDNNDLNKNIIVVVEFVNFISELFETLNNLEFIGKRKEGVFVDEKKIEQSEPQKTTSSRFLAR